ncbi:MAG: serine hydrolase domain-containing protein [Caldilineaceae bacterium]
MNRLKLTKLLQALICLSLILYWVAPATAIAQSSPTPVADQTLVAIDTYLETQMQALRIPGLALGIVQGDQVVHLKGYGMADPSGRAVTPQTPFMLNSISKSFVALAIMQLVEQDKIELDAPVQHYLPWFRIADEVASVQSLCVSY